MHALRHVIQRLLCGYEFSVTPGHGPRIHPTVLRGLAFLLLATLVSGTTAMGSQFSVGKFSPWSSYSVPNGLWLTGDFNGDGKRDILHAVQNTDYAHVWTSNGKGGFTVGTFRPWAGYSIPNGNWLTGDFNGDGKTDILHAVQNTDYAHVWTSNGNGTFNVGTFSPWKGYAIPNGVWVTGDFDKDGKTDVVHAVQNTSYVHIWKSRGNAQFTVSTFSPWDGYGIPNGEWLVEDFSGDGRTDIVHVVNNSNYVHPWTSTMAAPGEMGLDGIEVNQVVQDMHHDVPLVSKKPTIVRVYLNSALSRVAKVTGTLSIQRVPGPSMAVSPTGPVDVDPAQSYNLRTQRESFGASLNFVIPSGWTATGKLTARLLDIKDSASGAVIPCADCASSSVTVDYSAVPPLRVRLVGLQYSTGPPPQSFAPTAKDFNLIQSWLRRAYPISQLISSQTTVNATNTWPFDCNKANAQVSAIRNTDVGSGTDSRTHYYGVVSDGGGFMRGCSSGIPSSADPSTVASGPTGPGTGSFAWDTDGSYGDWYAGHELAHTFGRKHPGFCGGNSKDDSNYPYPNGHISPDDGSFVGLDTGDTTVAGVTLNRASLPGATWSDVMTYCSYQWMSNYTYSSILSRLRAENPGFIEDTGLVAFGVNALRTPVEAFRPNVNTRGVDAGTSAGAGGEAQGDPFAAAGPPEIETAYAAPPTIVVGNAEPPKVQEGAGIMSRGTGLSVPIQEVAGHIKTAQPLLPQPPAIHRTAVVAATEEAAIDRLAVQLQRKEFINVVATLNLTRMVGKIEHVNPVSQALLSANVPQSPVHLILKDKTGRVITDQMAAILEDTDIPPNEDKTGLVDAMLPFSPEAAEVELVWNNKLLDRYKPGDEAPAARNLRVIPLLPPHDLVIPRGEAPSQPITITWEGNASMQSGVTYTVQLTNDGGQSWQTVALKLTSPTFTLDRSIWGDAKTIMVRIIATNGFTKSMVKSETIQTGP